ncbi:MAG TPA: hypothetical protein VMU20_18650 [Candidatus Dormibacteraeota bacterium]|nr:hypothetical protein [Candidatus Dormibacteraeota bacterium]
MSVLRETNEQILAGIRHRWKSDAERRRMAEPIRLIDGLIADLEELHLTDRKRVPPSYEGRLMHLTMILPPEVRQELRSRVTIVHLMDRLYEIQGRLLARKATERGDDFDDRGPHGTTPPPTPTRVAEPAA